MVTTGGFRLLDYTYLRLKATGRSHCRAAVIIFALILTSACSGILRIPVAVPESVHLETTVLGRNDLRIWGDEKPPALMREKIETATDENYAGIMHQEHNYLAISGGGANGAYGAGLLVGWSKTGTRPEFTMVTGISTGALTAPFAFLGSAYDKQLEEVYTTMDSSSIFHRRKLWSIVGGDSLVDSAPLASVINKYVTDELIAAIAVEARRGRGLFVGTTNLDAGRPVIWNIGRMANSGGAGAGDLIRSVLRASASIPGVFPPVYIEVTAPDGTTYTEMHVDGGTSSQIFLYPSRTDWASMMEALDVKGRPRAYLIRNSRILPEYDPVSPRLGAIAGRSVGSLIRSQGIGDAYRIAAITKRDGIDAMITWIPLSAVHARSEEVFDPVYMRALFDYGYKRALTEDSWSELDLENTEGIKVQ
jgi:predicted acylesterase/phospholipase RssA